MKTLGYIWDILKNIIKILVVFVILMQANTAFEKIVFSSLLIIYISISSSLTAWYVIHTNTHEKLNLKFDKLKKIIIKDALENSDEEINERDRELQETAEKRKITSKIYIDIAFKYILYIMALINLYIAVMSNI